METRRLRSGLSTCLLNSYLSTVGVGLTALRPFLGGHSLTEVKAPPS